MICKCFKEWARFHLKMEPGKLLFLFLSLIPSSHLFFIPTFPFSFFFSPTPFLRDVKFPQHPFISAHALRACLTLTDHHCIRFFVLGKLVRKPEGSEDRKQHGLRQWWSIHNRKYSGDTKTQRLLRFDIGAAPAFTVSTGTVEPRDWREVLESKVAEVPGTVRLERTSASLLQDFPSLPQPQEGPAKSLLA